MKKNLVIPSGLKPERTKKTADLMVERLRKMIKFFRINRVILVFATIKLLAHLLTGNNYGYHGDELYTIACSRHLDFGYVDIPPLAPALLALNTWIFGNSLFAIHVLPAIAGALTVVFGGLTAKQLGGRKFAQGLTCLAILMAPVWLTMNTMFAYDSFDQLFTVIFLYFLLILLKYQNLRTWLLIGVFAGITLLTKPTMLFFGFALLLALIMTRQRKYFTTKWLWLAMGIAGLLLSPYLLWQAFHSWPVAEYWRAYSQYKTSLLCSNRCHRDNPDTQFVAYSTARDPC